MKTEHLSHNIQARINEVALKEFFHAALTALQSELQKLRDTIYNYDEHEYLFGLNERAWVGAFNNAILRAFPDRAVCLQEYSVYDKQTFVGRADLLVNWKDQNSNPVYLLFEAKQYEETSKSDLLGKSSDYLKTVAEQGKKYFNAEHPYYKDKKVFIIAIVFGWIRKKGFLEEAKKYLQQDATTDFCSIYFEGDQGAWVYGNIYAQ